MIHEYALEPEMVATWGKRENYRFFIRAFDEGKGRRVSRYPKSWAKKVWNAYAGRSDFEKKRLEELLIRITENMVKRKNCQWDENIGGWLQNAIKEHERFPFHAIIARKNSVNHSAVVCEDDLSLSTCPKWETPHGISISRNASNMADIVWQMLFCCRWVRFIDPFFSQCKNGHRTSLAAFLKILKAERPVGSPEAVEIHTRGGGADMDFLKDFFENIIPAGISLVLFQWREKPGSQKLHNRYILTDLGGVSFYHGLDAGKSGETDDVSRMDRDQYHLRCTQYHESTNTFEEAEKPLFIDGKSGG